MAQNEQEDVQVILETRYSTISSGVFIILLIWGFFAYLVFSQTGPLNSRPKALLIVIAIVLGLMCYSSAELKAGKWGFGKWRNDISIDFRKRLLPLFAGCVILTVAAMVSVSGGAINSSFSHFLSIISSLSIVLAATWRTRAFITGVSVIAYLVTSWFPPFLELRPLLAVGQITLLHNICFATSVLLAVLATYDRKPEMAQAVSKAQTS